MKKKGLAKTPPMGWNSWDCYGASVCEDEVRRNAAYMAEHLAEFGWEYVVVDIQWYEPEARSNDYNPNAYLVMDQYGRLLPAENRFPSAAGGAGFAPLAEYVHELGLKFGIHILRGIPKQAVRENCPVMGTEYTAAQIADFGSVCEWNGDMCGVDMSRPGSQEYYNAIFSLYAQWGVDFVKVDDIARPYHKEEIEAIRKAIAQCGRDMVLSLSPGAAPVSEAKHLAENANMWRMSDDFWDAWPQLRQMFDYCREWFPYVQEEAWPDCDMLPLGRIGIRSLGGGRMTNFTEDEQRTLMTLWCMFRSPLMFGGDLTQNDDFTKSLLQNRDLLEIDQHSCGGREVYRKGNEIVWAANGNDGVSYLARFNVGEEILQTEMPLSFIGFDAGQAEELWTGRHQNVNGGEMLCSQIPAHGVCLYRIIAQ